MATNDRTQLDTEAAPIAALLRRERKRFSTYWTIFQEMGIRGELPEWVSRSYPNIGKHEDWDAQDADQSQTDKVVKGEFVASKYTLGLDAKNALFVHDRAGWLLFQGKPSELPANEADVLFELTASQLQMYVHALRCETLGVEVSYG